MEEHQPSSFGARLKLWRERRNLSQAELARRANVDRAWVSRLETGERTNVSVWIVRRIARVLGVGIDDLVNTFNGDQEDPDLSPAGALVGEGPSPLPVTHSGEHVS